MCAFPATSLTAYNPTCYSTAVNCTQQVGSKRLTPMGTLLL